MNDWRIRRREERCGRCERAFLEGESFFSLLFVASGALGREDRCSACFETRSADGDPGATELLFWRARHRPDRARSLAVDFDAVEELFLALGARSEERLLELRYLLALLLLRKKRLKLTGMRRREGTSAMSVRRPRREEDLEVAVFELSAERNGALRDELGRIFAGAGAEALLAEAPRAEPDLDRALDPGA